jgi:hypothetical protein
MDWINIKDKLPEKEGQYLVLHKLHNGSFYPDIIYFYLNTKETFWSNEVPDYSKNVFVYSDSEWGYGIDTRVEYWCEIPDYSSLEKNNES